MLHVITEQRSPSFVSPHISLDASQRSCQLHHCVPWVSCACHFECAPRLLRAPLFVSTYQTQRTNFTPLQFHPQVTWQTETGSFVASRVTALRLLTQSVARLQEPRLQSYRHHYWTDPQTNIQAQPIKGPTLATNTRPTYRAHAQHEQTHRHHHHGRPRCRHGGFISS